MASKTCTRCGIEKCLALFQIRKASNDGLTASCKQCLSAYDKKRANLPHRVKAREEYAKTPAGIKAGNKAKNSWAKRNRKKDRASNAVCNAVRDGKLSKMPCGVCGSEDRIHGHHDDYDKPLDVRWLCSKHHRQWHRENGEGLNP